MDDNIPNIGDNQPPIPAWRLAVEIFRSSEFRSGHLVPHKWLWDAFGLEQPTSTTPFGVAEKAQLAFLEAFAPFSRELLEEDRIALASVKGHGYRIVPANEQVAWAESEGDRELRKALSRRYRRTAFVNISELGAEERRDRSDALARVGNLKLMLTAAPRPRFRLPGES